MTDLPSADAAMLGFVFVLVGTALFLWGCGSYAKGKGYTGFLGILGFLHLIGLIMLVMLPDKHKQGGVAKSEESSNSSGSLDAIERLAELREKGVLTDAEFQQKKQELL